MTLRKWDGGWQDQGQVLSKDLGPTTSLGLGAWLKAEAHRWSRSRPSILLIGPRQGAPGPRSSHHCSGKWEDAAPHPWPGRPGGVASARPRQKNPWPGWEESRFFTSGRNGRSKTTGVKLTGCAQGRVQQDELTTDAGTFEDSRVSPGVGFPVAELVSTGSYGLYDLWGVRRTLLYLLLFPNPAPE